jgi:MFS family permease
VAVTASLAVAALIHGLTLPLLSLVLEKAGVSSVLIGLNTAAQFVSIFVVAPYAPRLMRTVGPIPLMFWSILVIALIFIALPLHVDVTLWFVLRFIMGIGLSFLWIGGEAMVNHVAEEHVRGRVIALYGAVTAGGFAVGPVLLAAVGSEGVLPFFASAAVMGVAALPLLVIFRAGEKLEGEHDARLWRYVLLAPVAMWVYFVFSATDTVLLTFFPSYGVAAGLTEAEGLVLITVLAIGVIAFQYPIGWLADHVDRFALLLVCVVLCLIGAAALPLVVAAKPWNAVFMFLYGGALGALFAVPLALLGERFKGADLGAASTTYSIMFCLGAIAGPFMSGVAIDSVGEAGLPATLVVLYLVVVPLPALAWLKSRAGKRGQRNITDEPGEETVL